jgi:energy-coupling factor transporter ATP-binding protein EcfA2
MDTPLVIDNLSFGYPSPAGDGEIPILQNLSVTLPAGKTSVVLGPADSGKTTLVRILVGAAPRFTGGSLTGSARFGGRELTRTLPYELVETVGCVSQNADEQIITTRCDTEIAFALESLGVGAREMRKKVADSLRLVGLDGFEDRNPSTLSGGEKKRLMIACLAALGPDVWVMDECLLELDRSWRRKVLDLLHQQGRTVLALDSRITPLLEEKGAQFAVLSGGQILSRAGSAREPEFVACAAREGILPGTQPSFTRAHRVPRTNLLKARGIRFSFPGFPGFSLAVDSLELQKGSVCALLGDNGSGKSTLGRTLCGLLVPAEGTLSLWAGTDYRTAAADELNGRVGYLFQNPDAQIFLPTVFEELAFGLRRQGIGGRALSKRVEEACGIFSLPDPSAPPALMSYGARRRLQAAICYLLERDLLVLDEVDTGLSYRELSALLSALRSTGAGILLITHDLPLARAVSDRILLMEKGSLVRDLSPQDFDAMEALGQEPRGPA